MCAVPNMADTYSSLVSYFLSMLLWYFLLLLTINVYGAINLFRTLIGIFVFQFSLGDSKTFLCFMLAQSVKTAPQHKMHYLVITLTDSIPLCYK
jgi:hypothetical protein